MSSFLNNLDILNIGSGVSLSKVLLIFYILILTNITPPALMSKQMKALLEDNRIAQHIIGFITMIVLISIIGNNISTRAVMAYSIIAYLWFIMTTKMDAHWNIIIMIILVIGYLYENDLEYRENNTNVDKILAEDEKNDIKRQINMSKTYIALIVLILTIIGTYLYNRKKDVQYGGGYDIIKYLFY